MMARPATITPLGGEHPACPDRAGAPGCSEITMAREIRARGLVAGLSLARIAEEIHDGCGPEGPTWIRAYRLALGISLADVVAQVRAWYASEGRPAPRFSETLLSAYESGQKRPGPEYLHYLCTVYRAEPSDLGYPGRCFCGRAHRPGREAATTVLAAPGDEPRGPLPPDCAGGGLAGPECQSDAEAEDDDDVLRRGLLRLIAHAASPVDERFLGAVDRIRRRMDEALVYGTVSATMLDQWEETTLSYARQYQKMPPLRLLCDVLLDFGDVRRMCEHRQPLESTERLCRLAAQLAGLAAMLMIDIGDQRLARAFCRTARTAADETGDRHLRGWVMVREAMVPLYYGDPREAALLARAGSDMAGHGPSVAGTMGPMLEARAAARMAAQAPATVRKAARRRASLLVGRAHTGLVRLPAADRQDTAFGYTEGQLLFHEGDVRVALGDHKGAERAFTLALQRYSQEEILDRSLVTLGLARCQLEADEPEEALRLGQETVLSLPREHRAEILVRTARSLGDCVVGRHGEFRAVRDYRDALIAC